MTARQKGAISPPMANALDLIIAYKREEVAALKQARSRAELDAACQTADTPRGFIAALDRVVASGENGLICEMKRKSPSAGDILPGADPLKIAADYEDGGAACLSVLTDGPSFGGSLEDFAAIRAAVSLPMLRKDFMIDPIQVLESRAAGADAVLVILSCCDDILAGELIETSITFGMDVLIETHDEREVDRALTLSKGKSAALIGINNRDLTRMVTDLSTTERLSPLLDRAINFVSESGIRDPEDIVRLRGSNAHRFLIGESLMKRADRKDHCGRLRSAR